MCRILAIGDETATLDRPVALHGMTLPQFEKLHEEQVDQMASAKLQM